MKIYVIISETDPDYRENICVSENIEFVYNFCLDTKNQKLLEKASLEIWENDKCYDAFGEEDMINEIISIINKQGGIKEYDTEKQ